MNDIFKNIDKDRIPKHVAVIMDGNGRWAKKNGLLRAIGHKKGVNSVRSTCLLYTSPSPRDYAASRMPSSA